MWYPSPICRLTSLRMAYMITPDMITFTDSLAMLRRPRRRPSSGSGGGIRVSGECLVR